MFGRDDNAVSEQAVDVVGVEADVAEDGPGVFAHGGRPVGWWQPQAGEADPSTGLTRPSISHSRRPGPTARFGSAARRRPAVAARRASTTADLHLREPAHDLVHRQASEHGREVAVAFDREAGAAQAVGVIGPPAVYPHPAVGGLVETLEKARTAEVPSAGRLQRLPVDTHEVLRLQQAGGRAERHIHVLALLGSAARQECGANAQGAKGGGQDIVDGHGQKAGAVVTVGPALERMIPLSAWTTGSKPGRWPSGPFPPKALIDRLVTKGLTAARWP